MRFAMNSIVENRWEIQEKTQITQAVGRMVQGEKAKLNWNSNNSGKVKTLTIVEELYDG